MGWFNNPWVIGIGAGVISGLLVFIVTRWLFSDPSKKETNQRVISANREIMFAIRSGISEGKIPTLKIIASLRSATARRFEIPDHLLFDKKELVDELIKEIMDSAFISSETKHKHCEELLDILQIKDESSSDPVTEKVTKRRSEAVFYDRVLGTSMGLMSGLMVTALLIFSEFGVLSNKVVNENASEWPLQILIMLASVAVVSAAVVGVLARAYTRVRRDRTRYKYWSDLYSKYDGKEKSEMWDSSNLIKLWANNHK